MNSTNMTESNKENPACMPDSFLRSDLRRKPGRMEDDELSNVPPQVVQGCR